MFKRTLTFILTGAMIFSMPSLSVLAEETVVVTESEITTELEETENESETTTESEQTVVEIEAATETVTEPVTETESETELEKVLINLETETVSDAEIEMIQTKLTTDTETEITQTEIGTEMAISETEETVFIETEASSDDGIAVISENTEETTTESEESDEDGIAVVSTGQTTTAIQTSEDRTISYNIVCGDNITAEFNEITKKLTISGTGKMYDATSSNYSSTDIHGFVLDASTIVIEEGITYIGAYMLCCGTNVTKISLPSTLTSIGEGAFWKTGFSSVTIPDGVTTIGKHAFNECQNLTTVKFSSSSKLVNIEEGAFMQTGVTKFNFPDSVTTIGKKALQGCTSLVKISLPSSLTTLGTSAFEGCKNLTGDIVIPSGVTAIPAYCFSGTKITSITIPDTVTSIDNLAFLNCSCLKSITIPASVTSIASRAFSNCDNLTEVTYLGTEKQWEALNITGTSATVLNDVVTYSDVDTSSVSIGKVTLNSLTNKASGIKLKWTKVSNADGYYIYRKTSAGSYAKIKTITDASKVTYTDKTITDKNSYTYIYKVVAYSNGKTGSGTSKKILRLSRVSLKKVKNASSKAITVKWEKESLVSGYQIQYATNKSFSSGKKVVNVSGTKKKSKIISGLKKGKTYYVRIRSYRISSGEIYYGAWSTIMKAKITK